nr:hypothetical protein CFP56_60755 [Quercus suber]
MIQPSEKAGGGSGGGGFVNLLSRWRIEVTISAEAAAAAAAAERCFVVGVYRKIVLPERVEDGIPCLSRVSPVLDRSGERGRARAFYEVCLDFDGA